jgi:hypothetical protein
VILSLNHLSQRQHKCSKYKHSSIRCSKLFQWLRQRRQRLSVLFRQRVPHKLLATVMVVAE